MKQMKRLGRGLEDFSHLFLSSKSEQSKPLSITKQDVASKSEGKRMSAWSISITSDKGAWERAFFTLNFALEMARQGRKVLMFDADFSLPRLCMLLGSNSHNSILNFIVKNGKEGMVADGIGDVKLITLDVDISDIYSLSESERDSLVRGFKNAEEEAEIMLINTSSAFIHQMIAVIKASSEIIVITPKQMTEMINAYGVIKTIFQINREAHVGIVSSRISVPEQADAVFKKMERVVKKFLQKPLYNYGYLPEDEEISLSMAKREPLSITSPSSKTIKCIREISQSVLKMNEIRREKHPFEEKNFSFIERLFSKSSV